jgi:hypothetical protein
VTAPRLERDRRYAAEVLVDGCTVYTEDVAEGDPVWDDELGHVVYPEDDVIWQGDCSVSANLGLAAGVDVRADDVQSVATYSVRVPLDATGIDIGHVVVIDRVHHGGDRSLLGLSLTVDAVGVRSHGVLRRLRCSLRRSRPPS